MYGLTLKIVNKHCVTLKWIAKRCEMYGYQHRLMVISRCMFF